MIGLACVCLLAFALLGVSGAGQTQQQQQDGRQRRTAATTPTPSPTPGKGAPKMGTPPPPPILKDAPPELPDPLGQEIDPESTIKIDTNLVNLNVRVIDRLNRPINDVRQDEFIVFEDGVRQPVQFFSREEIPISYGLAIDTTGSLRTQIDKVIEAGKTIINSNKPGDETFLVRFVDSEKIETVQDFTANKSALEDALDSLYIEGGQTAIIDAVYLSAERIANYKKGDTDDRRRRALILVTDGEDRSSYYKQDQLFQKLREEDVQIFIIGFVNELDREGGMISKSPREKAVKLIDRLAKETGGRAFYPQSLAELPGIANEIVRDLRTQYVIGYYPTNNARDGSYRAIKVQVADAPGKDKRIALTRSGRTAKREGGAATTAKPPANVKGNTTQTPARNNATPTQPAKGTNKNP